MGKRGTMWEITPKQSPGHLWEVFRKFWPKESVCGLFTYILGSIGGKFR